MSEFIRGKAPEFPDELADVAFLHSHNIPLAVDLKGLGSVPARIVDDMTILINGIADAREWERLEQEREIAKAKRGK